MNNIGWAIKQLQDGARVRRAGWNGKGMWLSLSVPMGTREVPATAKVLPCITMKTATGEILMWWLASQTDLLSTDWEMA